jgi:hypothetical protein
MHRLPLFHKAICLVSVVSLLLLFSMVSAPASANSQGSEPTKGGEVVSRIEGHCSVGVPAPATTWYLPEGSSSWGFECWLLIQNPNAAQADCTVEYMIEGSSPVSVTKSIPAMSRKSFNIADDIGSHDASIKVSSVVPVIPERAMYKNDRREGSDSIGTTTPSSDYFLAEGTTSWGFTTYVLIQNPQSTATTVTVTYMTGSGPQKQEPFIMQGNSRHTIRVNDFLQNADFSTQVHGNQPIIAERSMYWGDGSKYGEACHDSIGVSRASNHWYLAEGSTNGGFETWVLVQNPGDKDTVAQITYMTEAGALPGPSLDLKARTRQTVNVADTVPNTWSVSTKVSAGAPVIAERSVYWGERMGGHNSIGVSDPSVTWYLAEGCTNGGFETWVLVQNPGETSTEVSITYNT